MTNHWRDIKHADVILINGANPAEAHPVGFQWFVKAKLDPTKGPGSGGGAKIIHADPRYTRTSAMADMYLRIRTGTDVAYFGGLINYVIQNKLYHEEYVKNYTNASFIVKKDFDFKDGLFTGYNSSTRSYDISTWAYELTAAPASPAGGTGGGRSAERGHANSQSNTYHAISWETLPVYLRIPGPGQKNLTDYVNVNAPKKSDPNSWNFFGTNYRNFMVSLLKAWYGAKATKDNEYAFDFIPKPAVNSSWMSIYDQALKGKMEGVMLSGMTATSIGPDSNQVMTALGKLKWLVVMDPLPTTSSEFWKAPNVDSASIQTEVFMLPTTHWIEKRSEEHTSELQSPMYLVCRL